MPAFLVAGATSWGVTLAGFLATGGADVTILARTPDEAATVDRDRGLARLPGFELPATVQISPIEAAPAADGIVVAVPAQSFRATAQHPALSRDVPVLTAAKGIEHGSLLRMSEVLAACGWPAERISALSGPNLAREIVAGLPAASTVASAGEAEAEMWQHALSTSRFRVYRSADLVGVELGGALKNVVAIAAGVGAGLGLGANALASLTTRGLAEITRLAVAEGASATTLLGLAGVGDLMATCYSPLSRNHRFGERLAAGDAPEQAMAAAGGVVEGAATAPVALALAARHGLDMPIAEQVNAVISGERSVTDALEALLSRDLRAEG
ncbi:MAG: NAD(P)-dependent glycerol-3-phosphate dehydrogenase [Dehalococcoidia bacterium]|nr:NAD(P)-dependent glycerol-3-phosphate dehydrogenase [Dehalococcoidia bacterium]